MPYSASRGLLYSAPPSHESSRRPDADEEATDEGAATPRADDPEATTEAAPTPADD